MEVLSDESQGDEFDDCRVEIGDFGGEVSGQKEEEVEEEEEEGEKVMIGVILLQDNPKGLGGPTGPIRGFPQFVILWALRLGLIFLIC